jgi:hypothetical protein
LPGERGFAAKLAVLPQNGKRFKLLDANALETNRWSALLAEVNFLRLAAAYEIDMHRCLVFVALGAEHSYLQTG